MTASYAKISSLPILRGQGILLNMRRPLLFAALLYAAGVLLGEMRPQSPFILLAIAVTAGLACFGCWWVVGVAGALATHRANLFAQSTGLGVLLGARLQFGFAVVLLVFAGWTNHVFHTAILSPLDLRQLIQGEAEIITLRGQMVNTPLQRITRRESGSTERLLVMIDAESIGRDDQWQTAGGRVMVATTNRLDAGYYAGRRVEVDGVIARPSGPMAPDLFDYRQYLMRRGIHFELRTDEFTQWSLLDTNAPPSRPLVDRFRQWSTNNLARGLPEQDEALELLWAMSLGWRTALTGEVKEPFMRSGTMHLFAISGLHIGMVAAILIGLLRVLRVPRHRVGLAAIPLLWFYTAATGWQPSAVRATIMISVILMGWTLKRPVDLLNSVGAAAFIILLWDPQQMFQTSFQLSFTVVFGLALILPPLMDRLRPWISPDPMLPRALWSWWRRAAMTVACWLVNGIAVSLTAWLVSAPLIATYFHLFTPASLIANVPVVACGMLALVSCFGSLLCGSWLAPITELFNHAAWFFMKCMMMISRWVATLPGAFHYVRGPDAYFFVAYYTGLFGLGTGWLLRPKVRRWALGGFVVVMIVGVTQWQTDRKTVRLNLLPGTPAVFQEDFARRSNLLVDTGDARGIESSVIPILQTRGVDGLNAIALTHASKHQVAGLTNLIKIMPPQIVHRSHAKIRSTRYSRAIDELLAARPNLERRVSVGDHIGAWEVLHPGRGEDQSRNIDNALVLRAKFHGVRVLLMSDLGEIGQELLVRRVDDLRADLLITSVPNFGEPLQPWLLEAIKPRVILVHDSYFPLGERAPAKLRARLARIEAQVYYTTDVGGTRVEIAPGDWRVLNASGILWSSR